jgi:hypothetical protein
LKIAGNSAAALGMKQHSKRNDAASEERKIRFMDGIVRGGMEDVRLPKDKPRSQSRSASGSTCASKARTVTCLPDE